MNITNLILRIFFYILFWVCVVHILSSCHTVKSVQSESVNIDSIVNSVKTKSKVSFDSLNAEYKRTVSELTNIGATFVPCPPAVVPDSILKYLDSAAQWRIMLWQRDNKIQALNTKLKVNADGSFETTQQVSSLQIAKSRTEDENIALKRSNTILSNETDSIRAELKKVQESKSKDVVRTTAWAWWLWFLIGFISCGALVYGKKLFK